MTDGRPLWVGTTQTLRFVRPLPAIALWRPEGGDPDGAHVRVREALADLPQAESPHPDGGRPVLRVRVDGVDCDLPADGSVM